jgi:hypothetical protein
MYGNKSDMKEYKMSLTRPPLISDQHIELFGPKGREIYKVKKISFHSCSFQCEGCVHDIFITCKKRFSLIDPEPFSEFLTINNVSYEDLVQRGYIRYLQKSNIPDINIMNKQTCKLIKIPAVK